MEHEHPVIYLSPMCDRCPTRSMERAWAPVDMWAAFIGCSTTNRCGAKPVRYVLADTPLATQARVAQVFEPSDPDRDPWNGKR